MSGQPCAQPRAASRSVNPPLAMALQAALSQAKDPIPALSKLLAICGVSGGEDATEPAHLSPESRPVALTILQACCGLPGKQASIALQPILSWTQGLASVTADTKFVFDFVRTALAGVANKMYGADAVASRLIALIDDIPWSDVSSAVGNPGEAALDVSTPLAVLRGVSEAGPAISSLSLDARLHILTTVTAALRAVPSGAQGACTSQWTAGLLHATAAVVSTLPPPKDFPSKDGHVDSVAARVFETAQGEVGDADFTVRAAAVDAMARAAIVLQDNALFSQLLSSILSQLSHAVSGVVLPPLPYLTVLTTSLVGCVVDASPARPLPLPEDSKSTGRFIRDRDWLGRAVSVLKSAALNLDAPPPVDPSVDQDGAPPDSADVDSANARDVILTALADILAGEMAEIDVDDVPTFSGSCTRDLLTSLSADMLALATAGGGSTRLRQRLTRITSRLKRRKAPGAKAVDEDAVLAAAGVEKAGAVVGIISRIVCHIDHPLLTYAAGEIFVDHFTRHTGLGKGAPLLGDVLDVKSALLSALADVAVLSSQREEYGHVCDTLLSTYVSCDVDPLRQLPSTKGIPPALLRIAQSLNAAASPYISDFQTRLLRMFAQLALECQRSLYGTDGQDAAVYQAGADLSAVLPAVAAALGGLDVPSMGVKGGVDPALIRPLWLASVLFSLNDGLLWGSESVDVLGSIAASCPILLTLTSTGWNASDVDAWYASIVKYGVSDTTAKRIKQSLLTSLLPDNKNPDAFYRSLDLKDVLFLASVCHLEVCRVGTNGNIAPMFHYLMNSGKPEGAVAEDIETEAALSKVLSLIADCVLKRFVVHADGLGRNEDRQTMLGDRCKFLLSLVGHRRPVVRGTALRHLVSLLDRYTSIQSDYGCLFALLDVVEALTTKAVCLNNPDIMASGSSESSPLALPSSVYLVDAPSSVNAIIGILSDIISLAGRWLTQAGVKSTGDIQSFLQAYIRRLTGMVSGLDGPSRWLSKDRRLNELIHQHAGLAIALHSACPTALDAFQPLVSLPGRRKKAAGGAGPPSSASVARSKVKPRVSASVVSGVASDADSVSSGTPLGSTAVALPVSASFDPVLLLASRAAPAFALLLQSRSTFLGQVQGMALLHSSQLSNSKRAGLNARVVVASFVNHRLLRVALGPVPQGLMCGQQQLLTAGVASVSSGAGMLSYDRAFSNPWLPPAESSDSSSTSSSDDELSVLSDTTDEMRSVASDGPGSGEEGKVKGAVSAPAPTAASSKPPKPDSSPQSQRGVPPPPVPGGKGGIKVPSLHRGNSGKGSPSQKRPVPTVVVSVASRTPTPTKQDVPPIPTPPLSLPPILPVPASVLPSLPSHVPATPMIRLTTSSFFGSIALFAMAINRQARASRTAAQQAQHQSSAVREVLSQAAAFLVWKYEEGSTAPGSLTAFQSGPLTGKHAWMGHSSVVSASDAELLALVGWMAARHFDPAVAVAAAESWTWIMTDQPQLRLPLLTEITGAWIWTVQRGYGLFSGTQSAKPAAVTSSGDESLRRVLFKSVDAHMDRVFGDKSAPDTVTSSEPHRVWIRFFEAHARHSRQSSTEELALIATAVSTALIDCDALSTAPESFGARVRLLHLGLTLLHTAHATTVTTPATLAQFVRAVSTDTTDPLHGRVAVSQCFVDARVCTTDGSPVSTDSWLFNGSRKSNAFSGGLGGLACFPPSLLQPLRSDSLDAADNYWNQPRFAPSPSPYDHTIAAGGLPGVPLDTSESAAPPKARKAFESSPPPVMGGDAWLVVAVGSLALFRQRILKAGLLWFALPQSCYEAVTSPERVREDFDYITGLCHLLRVDVRYLHTSVTSTSRDRVGDASVGIATRSSARVFTFSDWNDSATGIARRASVTTSTPFLQTPVPMSSPSQDPRADKIQDLRRRVLNLHTKSSSVFKLPRAAPKLARDGSDGSWTGSLASLSSRRDGDYASSALLTSKSGVSTSVPSESGRPVDATAKLARSMIELLVLLLGHEIDTIAAWHNPTNAPHKLLPHQTEYSFEASLALRTDESAWMSHATVGWDVSPALAVQMTRRFKAVAALREVVTSLVLDQPKKAIGDPDAVELLLVPGIVSTGAKQLQYLSVWAPARMHVLLSLLSRCGPDNNAKSPLNSHPLIGAYVARSLRSYDTAALAFVLPQLVQALRHDAAGQIAELLVDLCKRSALLSHQLMWILNSESKSSAEDGHGPQPAAASAGSSVDTAIPTSGNSGAASSDAPLDGTTRHGFQAQLRGEDSLPAIVIALRDRILASFSGPSKRMFDVEYTFFDRVTNISGILKRDVRDPSLRKPKIKEALRDIRIKAELDSDKQKWRDDDIAIAQANRGPALPDDAPFSLTNPMRTVAQGAGNPTDKTTEKGTGATGNPPPVGEDSSPADPALPESHHAGSLAGVAGLLGGKRVADGDKDIPAPCVYMPTSPYHQVVSVDVDSGRPMQSAAKCPFLLTFNVQRFEGPDAALRRLVKAESNRKRALKLAGKLAGGRLARSRQVVQHRLERLKLTVRQGRADVARRLRKSGVEIKSIVTVVGRSIRDNFTMSSKPRKGSAASGENAQGGGTTQPEPHTLTAARDSHSDGHVSDTPSQSSVIKSDPGEESDVDRELVVSDSEGDDRLHIQEQHGYARRISVEDESGLRRSHGESGRRKGWKALAARMKFRGNSSKQKSIGLSGAASPSPASSKLSCIFKVYDDCRQDALAIQIIQLLKVAFEESSTSLSLFPYKVIPLRVGKEKAPGGIIECVPNVKSRDEIGKLGFPTLFDYFLNTFGRPESRPFEDARRSMIRSLAAYAVVCYLLQIKDRHNGNMLVTEGGHLVHIDFGFLLGISPGGNLGFETAAFKLTQEMIEVMGGDMDSEDGVYFQELVIKGFIIARQHSDMLTSLVCGMADSGLPCFKFPTTLSLLRSRFLPGVSDVQACKFMKMQVLDAANKYTTIIYDGIQKLQNNIHSEKFQ